MIASVAWALLPLALLLLFLGCDRLSTIGSSGRQPVPPIVASPPQPAAPALPTTSSPSLSSGGAQSLPDIESVVARVAPAVVHIRVETVSPSTFRRAIVEEGTGTGALIKPDGYILTNDHVVRNARRITVTLADGQVFENVEVVGHDLPNDLAVLRINAKNLPTVPFGDPSRLRVGQWVVAIGNALDLPGGPTVTVGVISALSRSVDEPSGATLVDVIQTDAAINPGNSGGPLLNLTGEMIGVNTAGIQGAQAIGFAISVALARPIAEDLIASGRVIYPYLGLGTLTVTRSIAAQYRLSVQSGVLLTEVVPNSPAARAGLQPGDVIVQLSGTPVATEADLLRALRAHKPGEEVQITSLRGTARRTMTATLAEAPAR